MVVVVGVFSLRDAVDRALAEARQHEGQLSVPHLPALRIHQRVLVRGHRHHGEDTVGLARDQHGFAEDFRNTDEGCGEDLSSTIVSSTTSHWVTFKISGCCCSFWIMDKPGIGSSMLLPEKVKVKMSVFTVI